MTRNAYKVKVNDLIVSPPNNQLVYIDQLNYFTRKRRVFIKQQYDEFTRGVLSCRHFFRKYVWPNSASLMNTV